MKPIQQAIDRLKDDQDRFVRSETYVPVADLSAEKYAAFFARGHIPLEREEGFAVVRAAYREIVPMRFHIPHGFRKSFKRNEFTFTTNQRFDVVLQECMQPRAGQKPNDSWMGQQTARNLRELHKTGTAHSVEVYREGAHVAGSLGVRVNGMFISLSSYSRYSGAGNATFLALQAILCRRSFEMHDMIIPSEQSRRHGGEMIDAQQYLVLLKRATTNGKALVFPTFDIKISLTGYARPLVNG